ncbi:MAG: hypothetical protein KFF68_05850 [Desulfosarcina sp.]|nr:hypothetical protein [Desulfosarcina sp.]
MTEELNTLAILAFVEKPSMRRRLFFGLLVPILLAQGLWVRQSVPKLAEAKGPREGVAGSGKPIRILVAGDSSAAGVGAPVQSKALMGCLLSRMAFIPVPRFMRFGPMPPQSSSGRVGVDSPFNCVPVDR